jgi:hypothetical protein
VPLEEIFFVLSTIFLEFQICYKLVPLYTDLFLYNSVCHQRLSRRFLLLDNLRCTNMKAALAACEDDIFPPGAANIGGWERTALSPEWAPSFPNLNLRASRTPRCYDTLLHCSRMFKSVCALSRAFAVARLLALRVRIPDVCLCDCCVLSGRGLFVGPITRPEESYRVWCVWVWSWRLDIEEALAH